MVKQNKGLTSESQLESSMSATLLEDEDDQSHCLSTYWLLLFSITMSHDILLAGITLRPGHNNLIIIPGEIRHVLNT